MIICEGFMGEAEGYVLRIASKEWVDQVFSIAVYYTSLPRKWKQGQTIVFLSKSDVGDAVVGYGVVQNAYEKDELSEAEKKQCALHGWKKAIEFGYVVRFDKPLLVKETFFKNTKLRGRCFHGYALSREQLEAIIAQAEKLQSQASH